MLTKAAFILTKYSKNSIIVKYILLLFFMYFVQIDVNKLNIKNYVLIYFKLIF